MRKNALLIGLTLAALIPLAQARDTVLNIPLADVLAMPEATGKLDGSIRFYLDRQHTPKVLKTFGTGIENEKTNASNKTDEFSCKWAALSALIRFEKRAKRNGANAVVGIVSYYKKNETKDPVTFECHAGTFVTGVALKGTYAKIAN